MRAGGRWRRKASATRHRLPPRHLEPVLQALVRHGILKGIRGPRGGYELAREQHRITADDILRAAGTVDEIDAPADQPNPATCSSKVVIPALSEAEQAEAGCAFFSRRIGDAVGTSTRTWHALLPQRRSSRLCAARSKH